MAAELQRRLAAEAAERRAAVAAAAAAAAAPTVQCEAARPARTIPPRPDASPHASAPPGSRSGGGSGGAAAAAAAAATAVGARPAGTIPLRPDESPHVSASTVGGGGVASSEAGGRVRNWKRCPKGKPRGGWAAQRAEARKALVQAQVAGDETEVARLNARLNSPVCKKRRRPVESEDGGGDSGTERVGGSRRQRRAGPDGVRLSSHGNLRRAHRRDHPQHPDYRGHEDGTSGPGRSGRRNGRSHRGPRREQRVHFARPDSASGRPNRPTSVLSRGVAAVGRGSSRGNARRGAGVGRGGAQRGARRARGGGRSRPAAMSEVAPVCSFGSLGRASWSDDTFPGDVFAGHFGVWGD